MSTPSGPALPTNDEELHAPFWAAAADDMLVVQECGRCKARFFIPQALCPCCWSLEWRWVPSPGTGTIYSFTVVHRAPSRDTPVPFVLAAVDLDDGWTMLSRIVDCEADDVRSGTPVTVVFRAGADGRKQPCFAPRDAA